MGHMGHIEAGTGPYALPLGGYMAYIWPILAHIGPYGQEGSEGLKKGVKNGPFWPKKGSFLTPFWGHFWAHFGPKKGSFLRPIFTLF